MVLKKESPAGATAEAQDSAVGLDAFKITADLRRRQAARLERRFFLTPTVAATIAALLYREGCA